MFHNAQIGATIIDAAGVAIGRRPPWLRPYAGGIIGTVRGPPGIRKANYANNSNALVSKTYSVGMRSGQSAPGDNGGAWQITIIRADGYTATANGLSGFPTIGTPEVRLTDNGPARAVFTIPPVPAITWSDGTTADVERGQGLIVEYRDADGGSLITVFHGMIRQVDKGEQITITAYDRLMDLAEYSDQYQPQNTHRPEFNETRTDDGTTVTYGMSATIGQIVSAISYNTIQTDPLPGLSQHVGTDDNVLVLMPLPTTTQDAAAIDITPTPGQRITKLRVKIYYDHHGSSDHHLRITVITGHIWNTGLGNFYVNDRRAYMVETPSTDTGTYTAEISLFHWTLSNLDTHIGVAVEPQGTYSHIYFYTGSTRYFTSGTYYQGLLTSSTWQSVHEVTHNNNPEYGLTYIKKGASIDIAQITASGSNALIPLSAIPAGPSDTIGSCTLTTVQAGTRLYLDYYILNSISLGAIIEDLIEAAGMEPDIDPNLTFGDTTYYTTSTFDYLSCILDLIRAADSGIKDTYTTGAEGTIKICPRHTLSDTPAGSYTTNPAGAGTQAILAHSLTSHWAAERATVAVVTEDATSSGLPIALETDDARTAGSLIEAMGSPMRQVISDGSLGTHQLLANMAGGRIKQLHINQIEGSITLAGYRTTLWDIAGNGAGGQPISLEVPAANVSGVTIPTEVIFKDGVTMVALDNIRAADRNEVAVSMKATADNTANSTLLSTVYIFAKLLTHATNQGTVPTASGVALLNANGGVIKTQTEGAYIKRATDSAGYTHVLAYIPGTAGGIAPTTPVAMVCLGTSPASGYIAPLENPKYVLANQAVHLDIRIPNTAPPS